MNGKVFTPADEVTVDIFALEHSSRTLKKWLANAREAGGYPQVVDLYERALARQKEWSEPEPELLA